VTVQALIIPPVAMRTNLLGYILSFDNSDRNKPDFKQRTKHLGDWQKHTLNLEIAIFSLQRVPY